MKIILVLSAVIVVSISKNITNDPQMIKNCIEVLIICHHYQLRFLSFGWEQFLQNFFQWFSI